MGSTEDSSFEISKEILDVAARMARPKNGQPYFDTLFAILQDFVLTKGEMIEHASVATVRGSHLSENDKVICQSFERLMLHVISGARSKLGAEWTSPKEQGNGQSALESSEKKPPSRRDSKETSKDCLAGMLDLLTVGLERCPTFVSHLPAGQGLDRDEDPLVRRATKAAAASLSDYDVSIVSSSIKFLCAAVSAPTQKSFPLLSLLMYFVLTPLSSGFIDLFTNFQCEPNPV